MVMMVLWGHQSPQTLQKVMELFRADLKLHKEGHLDLNGIDKMMGIGSKGQHENNCWRDLKKCCLCQSCPSSRTSCFL
jgi:hypothetical protein